MVFIQLISILVLTMNSILSPEAALQYNNTRNKDTQGLICLAPSTSMFIGLRGKIYSCCFNKSYPIGQYPKQSIHEIWNGHKKKVLMEAIKNKDLSLGCSDCYELINAKNFKALPAKNYDNFKAKNYPEKIDFELSNECNLECIMCRGEFSSAIRKNREKLPSIPNPYDDDFIEELKFFIPHLKHAHFLGGEPFMIKSYLKIWELIRETNPDVRISVQTNATILTDRVKKILDDLNFEIAISIDSIVQETYEMIRVNGVYNSVMKNIKYLRDYCNSKGTNFSISYCPMTINRHEIPGLISWCNELDCEVFFNTVTYPSNLALKSLKIVELETMLSDWANHIPIPKTYRELGNNNAYLNLVNHVMFWINEKKQSDSTIRVSNLEDYYGGLKKFIDKTNDEKSKISNTELFELITNKINEILNQAELSNKREEALEGLYGVSYNDLCRSVPNTSISELIHLFNTFITPIQSK